MLGGQRSGVLRQVQAVSIHGQPFLDLWYSFDDEDHHGVHQARVGAQDAYPNPQPGDRVKLDTIMSIVTRVEKIED